jgi:hypothetical protein
MSVNLKHLLIWSAVLAVAAFALAAIAGFEGFAHSYRWLEVTAALLGSALIIGLAGYAFFIPPIEPGRGVANAVAFNAVIFITVGFAAIVAATPRWAVGSFWGGACLLAGGFVGTLFGIPLHVDKDGSSSTNLMVDTANAASKLVAGATLAQLGTIYHHFQSMTVYLGYCLQCCANDWFPNGAARNYNSSLAGGIILYFSLAGFLAGILLPKFFFDTADPVPPAPAPAPGLVPGP